MAKKAAEKTRTAKMGDVVNGELDVNRAMGVSPDEEFVQQAAQGLREFFKGLAGFFTTAKAIETEALATYAKAKALAVPKTAEEDLAIQAFTRETSRQKRAAEDHWKITAAVSAFHRRLTAARARATDALEAANARSNQLHNAYVEAERRRVAEEQEQKRRAAEEQARKDREAELEAMEREAAAREEASADLSEREARFVDYITGPYPDGQRAAQQAGFRNPLQASARLLSNAKIQKAIQAKREAIAIREQAAAVKEQPLDVEPVEEVKANVLRAPGGFDRTTWRGEVLDAQAFMDAVFAGKHGIPRDVLMIDERALNGYAKELKKRLDLWPGVRAVSTTKTI